MVRCIFWVQRTDTSHMKQVWRALTCTIFVLVVIPLFQRNHFHDNSLQAFKNDPKIVEISWEIFDPKISQESFLRRDWKKKKHFQEMLRVRLKKSIYYTSIFFLPKLGGNHFQKSFQKKKKHWEIEISWEKTQSWGGTNPTLYTTSSAPLRQPSPVERRVVGGPSIGERRCRRRLSQWSHHQTRSRVLGMFSTFPLFILAF